MSTFHNAINLDAEPRQRQLGFRNPLVYWLLMFSASLGLSLLLYSKTLDDFLTFDDVGSLIYFQGNMSWWKCFLPTDNSLVRPAMMLLLKAIWTFFGTNPVPYHVASVTIHAAVAATSAAAFCALTSASRRAGSIIALAVAVAGAAFPTVYMISNTGDSIMTFGLLLLAICWVRFLASSSVLWLFLSLLALGLALLGKETAIAAAGIVIFITLTRRPVQFIHWAGTACVVTICIAYAALIYHLQIYGGHSYHNTGVASATPALILARYLNYLPATLFPGALIMEPLVELPTWLAFPDVLKVLAAITFVASVILMFLKNVPAMYRTAAACYLSASVVIWPALLLNLAHYSVQQQPSGRFVYAAIPFVIIAVGAVCLALRKRKVSGSLAIAIAVVWIVFQGIIIRKSPGTLGLQKISREWKNLSESLWEETRSWPHQVYFIVIYTGKQYGSTYLPENYGTALIRLYHPNLIANYYTNRVPPCANSAFVFDGKKLLDAAAARQ